MIAHARTIGTISSSRCQTTRRARLIETRRNSVFMDDVVRTPACRAVARSSRAKAGGARRDRTDDLLLAKQALSQLSYGPVSRSQTPQRDQIAGRMVGLGRLERPTSPLSGVRSNHLSYRPEPPRFYALELNASIPRNTPEVRKSEPRQGLVREERETKTAASRQMGL